jgi:hypothetical protein
MLARIAVQVSTHGAAGPHGIQRSPGAGGPQSVGRTQHVPGASAGQTGTGPIESNSAQ